MSSKVKSVLKSALVVIVFLAMATCALATCPACGQNDHTYASVSAKQTAWWTRQTEMNGARTGATDALNGALGMKTDALCVKSHLNDVHQIYTYPGAEEAVDDGDDAKGDAGLPPPQDTATGGYRHQADGESNRTTANNLGTSAQTYMMQGNTNMAYHYYIGAEESGEVAKDEFDLATGHFDEAFYDYEEAYDIFLSYDP